MTLRWVNTRSHRSTVVVVVNMQRVALGVWLRGGRLHGSSGSTQKLFSASNDLNCDRVARLPRG